MNKTTKIILLVVSALIIIMIVGAKAEWFGKKGNFKIVEVEEITLKDIVETVSATGKIQPEIEVKISSEVSGEIIELPFKEGQQVAKGDLLVQQLPPRFNMRKCCRSANFSLFCNPRFNV